MSARFFCATEFDVPCESVPSNAPNNLCPRRRSSSFPVVLRLGLRSSAAAGGGTGDEGRRSSRGDGKDGSLSCSVWELSRRRFGSVPLVSDGRRFWLGASGNDEGIFSGSGNATADASDLGMFT